ncbi:MAG: alginate lyase family protein [Oceanicaulis sp.]|nr:alginate lyase family protein [Oceanicaulis sp.]
MDDASKQDVRSGPAFTPDSGDAADAAAEAERAVERARLRALETEISTLRDTINTERSVREQAEAELKARLNQVRSLLTSTSWRVTAPLRHAVSIARTGKMAPTTASLVAELNTLLTAPEADAALAGLASEDLRKQAHARVRHVKARLLEHGFRERALTDFEALANTPDDPYLRALASWELAVWHANQAEPGHAAHCLRFLAAAASMELPEVTAQRIAILKAESLALTGAADEARAVLEGMTAQLGDADLYLCLSRLEDSLEAKTALINKALGLRGVAPVAFTADGATPYDRLSAEVEPEEECPLTVTVIVPAYNAQAMLETTLRSLAAQSWTNLEILVADDCSTDGTAALVEAFSRRDPRVRLVPAKANSGPYVARNLALMEARGYFVTCNDSDDWSHPEKIARQVRHLLANPSVVANTSQQARAHEDMRFSRRGNPGFYIQPNMSSLMFRREMVVERIGYWDSVRFGADSEYTRRIKRAFGDAALVDVETGPLSFQRQTPTSLTGSREFGYHGFKMGARLEYENNHRRFHKKNRTPYIGFPLTERPFTAPEPMWPQREAAQDGVRHFDVIIASDFRLPGGTNMSNLEEIKAQRRFGLKTGLVQMSRYDVSPDRKMNDQIAAQIDGDQVQLVVYGEKVTCDLLVVRLPWVLQEWQECLPQVDAGAVKVIVNQPPKRDYGPDSEYIYHLQRCLNHLKRHFGSSGTWHPIGPLVREALLTHHKEEMAGIQLGENWPNIIDVSEWRRPFRPARGERIRICRHSRDQYVKWPSSAEELLIIYPDDPRYEVHILGGADTPKALLGGKLPKYWRVTGFGKMSPRRFLSKFDVFVYYTHPDWVESFGRVIFEAMAVGLPVILPRVYEPLFKDAAIYAEPDEVLARVDELMADDDLYDAQVARALAYVETHFGHGVHAARLAPDLDRRIGAGLSVPGLGQSEASIRFDTKAYASFEAAPLEGFCEALASSSRSAPARLARTLLGEADEAMARGPYSVVDKTTLPPSGDRHDYWHPAPYWHPNPETFNGLPYIRKDGVRVPGTLMYEPESDKYDRTRLQMLFDDSTLLALATRLTGQQAYAERAAAHLRHWFLDPATRMNPHLKFAQVKPGHNGNKGSSSGVIEMKDFYYYLDAVRLMIEAGALSERDQAGLRAWLRDYAMWLATSEQGVAERSSVNNHGLYYDIQACAIGLFLNEKALVFRALNDAVARIGHHFAPDGSQPEELTRTTTAHYCCFNFQGWANMARLAAQAGVDLWRYETPDGRSLLKGAQWLADHAGKPWPYQQIDAFDAERFIPAWHGVPEALRPERPHAIPASPFGVKPRFHPHDGVRPYWNLG